MTPFKALYGRVPPTLFQLEDVVSATENVNAQIWTRNDVINELKEHLLKARLLLKTMLINPNVSFEKGDLVYLKLKPYRLKSLVKKNEKLSAKYYGPFEIEERIGQVLTNRNFPFPCFTAQKIFTYHCTISIITSGTD